MTGGRRFLFYTNECVGLGHLRRTISVAQGVSRLDPAASCLIVTGVPLTPEERLPHGVDTVKLPQLGRDGDGRHRPQRLGGGLERVHRVRAGLARTAAEAFEPDVVLVDKLPLGLARELVPTLEALRDSDARVVLGLRDVEDAAEGVRRGWDLALRRGIVRYYDHVLVYGPPWTPDALDVLGWQDLEVPVDHVGYVRRLERSQPPSDLPGEYLLVTVGGGADGFGIAACVLQALAHEPIGCPTIVVAGPLMPELDAAVLRALAHEVDARVLDYRPDLDAVIAGARAVVSMAGYNSVAEVVTAERPLLLVPRVQPSEEQRARAALLAEGGVASVLPPDELEPTRMRAALRKLLQAPPPVVDSSLYQGTERAASILCALADSPRAGRSFAVAG